MFDGPTYLGIIGSLWTISSSVLVFGMLQVLFLDVLSL